MTLDEAIKHCEEIAEEQEKLCKANDSFNFSQPKWKKCAKEHRQLAEWLKELKERKSKCKWIRYDYRTICPKNHDINNPYWRIPENTECLKYCPYCGKEIEVDGVTLDKAIKEDYWDDDGYGHETKQYNDTMLALDMAIKA